METAQPLLELQRDWTRMGEEDPILWTIGDADIKYDQYFESGRQDIGRVLSRASGCGVQPVFGKALDFGCGIGRLTQALSRHFGEVHGLDISPTMIAQAKTLNSNPEKCHFYVHANERLNLFASDNFDLVVAFHVFPYISPSLTNGYLREFIRILKPGGLVYFQMTRVALPRLFLPDCLLNVYRRWKHGHNQLLHRADKYHIGERTVRAVLEENGAKILHVETHPEPTLWFHYDVLATKEIGRS